MKYDEIYATFEGRIEIQPPLNSAEIEYLTAFAWTRHMHRGKSPFYVRQVNDITDYCNSDESDAPDVVNEHTPPPGQPGLWCDFKPTPDGTAIVWNGSEKTRYAKKWIEYIITRFLQPDAITKTNCMAYFKDFQYNHVCNGALFAFGESGKHRWKIVVKNNKVKEIALRDKVK